MAMSWSAFAELELALLLSCAGSDAVMPETLGSQITIERRLQRSGAAPYTIKDELGRKVSACKLARCNWQPLARFWCWEPRHIQWLSACRPMRLHLIWYHTA